MENQNSLTNLVRQLFERGLGEFVMMFKKNERVMLGKLEMQKGDLVFNDSTLLTNIESSRLAPCWDIGIVGAVCDLRSNNRDNLTYLGPDHCHIDVSLSTTRYRLLSGVVNLAGEDLITYKGSAYCGFKMLLDAHLLPVILPMPIKTRVGMVGLAVTDFRYATVPLDIVHKVNDTVRNSVERHLSLTVEDVEVSDEEFRSLFGCHLKK